MADIQITDGFGLSADLRIRDDSPLAKAGLTKIVATAKELLADFDKPIDEADERAVALGGSFTSPNLLSSDVSTLTAGVGINGELTIFKPADKLLFADEGFSPIIPISQNQAWLGVEFDFSAIAKAGVASGGLGISFEGTAKFTCASYTLFSAAAPSALPSLRNACLAGFETFSLVTSAADLRKQLPNTVAVSELTGSATIGVSFEQPFTLNPLASANLPFNESASIQPAVTLQLAPSLEISGDLLLRSWKVSDNILRLGVYKKRGSVLSVDFTAGASVGGDIGNDDAHRGSDDRDLVIGAGRPGHREPESDAWLSKRVAPASVP